MKRALLLGPLLIVLAACNSEPQADDPTIVAPEETATSAAEPAAKPPPEPEPAEAGPCPYLDQTFVEDTNGQRVGEIKVSASKPPTCFFYRSDGGLQMSVRVFKGKPAVAKAIVDQAAPVETSNPAELTGGWAGGAQPTDDGAVYAVAKNGKAVVVTTNQEQTIKAKVVAEQAISALGL